MNITLHICYIPNPDSAIDALSGSYSKGYILNVFETPDNQEPPNSESRFVFIHLKNVPDNYNFLYELLKPIYKTIQELNPVDGTLIEKQIIEDRRKWYVDFDLFTAETIAEFELNKQTTKIWTSDYFYMVKKVENPLITLIEQDVING